jgi:hypothetical protein
MDDISLSSISSDPSLDLNSDGSDGFASDYSTTAASALQFGTEIAAAVSGVAPAPAVVQQTIVGPLPPAGAAPGRGGQILLIAIVVVIVIVALMSFAE